MSWVTAFHKFGHRMFIAYIELKIEGSWNRVAENLGGAVSVRFEMLSANSENCQIHVIEPDGLRRILNFTEGGTIALHQNILSYHPEQVNELTVDEKEQSGKGKTREIL